MSAPVCEKTEWERSAGAGNGLARSRNLKIGVTVKRWSPEMGSRDEIAGKRWEENRPLW